MNEHITTLLNAAERHVQHSDEGWEFAKDVVGAAPLKQPRILWPRPETLVVTLCDSNPGVWVTSTYRQVDAPSVAPDPESRDMFLSPPQAFIRQIREDLDQLPGSVRSSQSAGLCRQFVEGVGMALANNPQARCAVFGDEEDGVTLVAHSRASMRQVSLEFGLEGNSINIVSIDEEMRRSERACGIDKVRTLGEAIAWLNPR